MSKNIGQQDIERYTAYKEFAQDGLYRCHPNDEKRFQKIIAIYSKVISAIEELEAAIELPKTAA